ncbi:hypothetical protein V6N12_049138 [Hibiscus sabdariffa]|uniref:Uncharacterized protein n=1 Tax=Hibiscus sabdariffa TaxID=183260 RepID=A0ABR2EJB3_9ROSI
MNLLLMDWLPPGLASSSASSSGMLVPADPGENGVRSDAIMMAHLAMVTAMVSYTSVGVEPAPTIVKHTLALGWRPQFYFDIRGVLWRYNLGQWY